MALTCNIDRKGRLARLISGILLLILGIVLAFAWALPNASWLAWMIVAVTIAGGLFQIFEAWKGWCVMRAMGFKTPM
jgi:uncharacterized membrane protein HdeD (DUF308 family)